MFQESQLIIFLAAYLIGSIPFGLILTRMAGMGDIRAVGSGNIGATNVLRAGGKKLALLTLLLDGAKGYVALNMVSATSIRHMAVDIDQSGYLGSPGLMSSVENITGQILLLCGLCTILGHCFPIWLKFKGGKGVATAFGVLFAISLELGLACAGTWLVVFAICRYSSVAALTAMAIMPFYAYLLVPIRYQEQSFILALIAALIIYRHKSNLAKLFAGEELKFGKDKLPKEPVIPALRGDLEPQSRPNTQRTNPEIPAQGGDDET